MNLRCYSFIFRSAAGGEQQEQTASESNGELGSHIPGVLHSEVWKSGQVRFKEFRKPATAIYCSSPPQIERTGLEDSIAHLGKSVIGVHRIRDLLSQRPSLPLGTKRRKASDCPMRKVPVSKL